MAARESLKGTTVKALPLGDRMETFGLLVIQDFLLKRGYVTAAKALSEEAKQRGSNPADSQWFELVAAIDHDSRASTEGPGTVLESLLGRVMATSRGTFDATDTTLGASTWPAGVSSDPYGESLFGESDPLLSGIMSRAPPSPGSGTEDRPAGASSSAGAGAAADKASALQHTASFGSLPTLNKARSIRTVGPEPKRASGGTGDGVSTLPSRPAASSVVWAPQGAGSTGKGSRSDVDELSKLSWIPVSTRLRILKREMDVMKLNTDTSERLEQDRLARAPTMTEVEAAKARERLLERPRKTPSKKPTCAVCEVPFALVNLPLVISYKAVLDLRASWGVEISDSDLRDPRLHPPRCYDGVRTCRFCAQFFEKAVRPPASPSPSKTHAAAKASPQPSKSPILFQ